MWKQVWINIISRTKKNQIVIIIVRYLKIEDAIKIVYNNLSLISNGLDMQLLSSIKRNLNIHSYITDLNCRKRLMNSVFTLETSNSYLFKGNRLSIWMEISTIKGKKIKWVLSTINSFHELSVIIYRSYQFGPHLYLRLYWKTFRVVLLAVHIFYFLLLRR